MNFKRKTTEGFSMGYVLLDFSASVTNFAQLVLQSIDQGFITCPQLNHSVPYGIMHIFHIVFLSL